MDHCAARRGAAGASRPLVSLRVRLSSYACIPVVHCKPRVFFSPLRFAFSTNTRSAESRAKRAVYGPRFAAAFSSQLPLHRVRAQIIAALLIARPFAVSTHDAKKREYIFFI